MGFVPSRYGVVWGSGPASAACLAGRLIAGFVVFLAEVFLVATLFVAAVVARFCVEPVLLPAPALFFVGVDATLRTDFGGTVLLAFFGEAACFRTMRLEDASF